MIYCQMDCMHLWILKFQLRKSTWKCLQIYTLTRLGWSDALDLVIIGSEKGMKWDGCETPSSYQDKVANIFCESSIETTGSNMMFCNE